MNLQDLTERLAVFGLEGDHARVYVQLVRRGPSKASVVADAAALNRTRSYRVLKDLVDQDLATSGLQRPTLYEAVPPAKVLSQRISSGRDHVEEMHEAREAILEDLQRIQAHDAEDGIESSWSLLHGRGRIIEADRDLVGDARAEIVALSSHAVATAGHPPLVELWEAAAERAGAGVDARAVLDLADPPPHVGELARGSGVELRHLDAQRLGHFVIRDGEELVATLLTDPSERLSAEGDVAIRTDAPDFVSTQRYLFEKVWEDAEPSPGDG